MSANPDDDFEPRPRARNSDPDTSHEAADSVEDVLATQGLVVDLLVEYGPMTDKAIWMLFVRKHGIGVASESGVRTRRSELVRKRYVVNTGEKVTLGSGRRAIVWGLV